MDGGLQADGSAAVAIRGCSHDLIRPRPPMARGPWLASGGSPRTGTEQTYLTHWRTFRPSLKLDIPFSIEDLGRRCAVRVAPPTPSAQRFPETTIDGPA